jgi:hypothetical protein
MPNISRATYGVDIMPPNRGIEVTREARQEPTGDRFSDPCFGSAWRGEAPLPAEPPGEGG